jgi:hypothetical protein
MIRKKLTTGRSLTKVDDNTLDLSITEPDQELVDEEEIIKKTISVPSKTILNNTDLKNLKGFRAVRKRIKQQNMKDDFIKQVSGVLDLFDKKDNHYEHEIIQFVCSVAEDFFISHGKMGELKEQAVIKCVAKYFNDDEDLVRKIIQLVLPNVPKTNILRRNKQRIINFFFILVEKF